MTIKAKAFERFREVFGKERVAEPDGKATAMAPLTELCAPHNQHDPIFDESGMIGKYANTLANRRHIRTELADGGQGCDIPSGGRWLK